MTTYYLLLTAKDEADIANIRHWENLKIAFDGNDIWIKDFDNQQVKSIEFQSMPFKTLFYEQDGKLFLQGSLLPDRNVPSLLWTPIARALPLTLPSFNHNFFGLTEKIAMQIIPSEREAEAAAMLTSVEDLKQYITIAPRIRLEPLAWVLLNRDKVLLFGTPLLPISGDVFWQRGDFMLPSGYDFELFLLCEAFNKVLNPEQNNLVFWNSDSTYFLIEKVDIQALSLGSFRRTLGVF